MSSFRTEQASYRPEFEVPKDKVLYDVKGTLMDWSGVASDDRDPVYISNMLILRDYGVDLVTFEEWLSRSKMNVVELLKEFGVHRDSAEVISLYHTWLATLKTEGRNPVSYPDTVSTMRQLAERGLPPHIISTHPQHELEKEVESYGVTKYVSGISGSLTNKSVEIMRVCEERGILPSEAVYIGDMVSDVEHGLAAGVPTIGVSTGYHSKERLELAGAHIVIPSFSDILQVIGNNRPPLDYLKKVD